MISSPSSRELLPEPLDMGSLLALEKEWKQLHHGEVIDGVIVRIDADGILVNVGGKSEGLVLPSEMQSLTAEDFKSLIIGDTLATYILQSENSEGQAELSVDRARQEKGWALLQRAARSGESLKATVVAPNRGGLTVRVEGVDCFVPQSHLVQGANNMSDQGTYSRGSQITVKTLELSEDRRRAVLSERQVWDDWRLIQKKAIMAEIEEGDIRTGIVTAHTSFGAFVELGGVQGLIHISELSWNSTMLPEQVLEVGEKVSVYVLTVDRESERISLSLRRLRLGPWQELSGMHAEGDVVKGTIVRLAPFGAFVLIDGMIEGLVHISELSEKHVSHPREVVHEGDGCFVKILRIDPEQRRISLSLKQCLQEMG
jgi:small subunit ribosomal protein S1